MKRITVDGLTLIDPETAAQRRHRFGNAMIRWGVIAAGLIIIGARLW